MAYELRTFTDIVTAVMEELKYQSTDTTNANRIRRDINMVYTDEVCPYEQWKWLRGSVDLYQSAAFSTGTCTATEDSNTVTLTSAPTTSKKGYWFSVDGASEVYRIKAHTASSTTVRLETPYTGDTTATGSFKIWTDKIALPVEARDTIQVTHDLMEEPLEGMGLQQYRRFVTSSTKAEGRPRWYTTSDYVDPSPFSAIGTLPAISTRASSGYVKTIVFASTVASLISEGDRLEISLSGNAAYDGEITVSSVSTTTTITYTGLFPLEETAAADLTMTVKMLNAEKEVERYRELWVYPSISTERTTLHVDFIKEAKPLSATTDEPLMPIGDRIVLMYGALMRAWTRERNPEEAARCAGLYERKLMKMAGKLDDSTDYPILKPSRTYLAGKRNPSRKRRWLRLWLID